MSTTPVTSIKSSLPVDLSRKIDTVSASQRKRRQHPGDTGTKDEYIDFKAFDSRPLVLDFESSTTSFLKDRIDQLDDESDEINTKVTDICKLQRKICKKGTFSPIDPSPSSGSDSSKSPSLSISSSVSSKKSKFSIDTSLVTVKQNLLEKRIQEGIDQLKKIYSITDDTEMIGRGAFGIVYKIGSLAIKILNLKSSDLSNSEVLNSFRFNPDRGDSLAISLGHVNSCVYLTDTSEPVPITDIPKEGDFQIGIVMPYYTGEGLDKLLNSDKLIKTSQEEREQIACRVGSSIAQALCQIHKERIAHRDIKPQNIILDGKIARLCDWGLAKKYPEIPLSDVTSDTIATMTKNETPIGTNEYMAPERLSASRPMGPEPWKSDMWSLGLILFKIATLTVPAELEIHALMSDPEESISSTDLEKIKNLILRKLIKEMLTISPDRRPSSVEVVHRLATL